MIANKTLVMAHAMLVKNSREERFSHKVFHTTFLKQIKIQSSFFDGESDKKNAVGCNKTRV